MILLSCPQYCHNVFQQLMEVIRNELREHLHYDANVMSVEDVSGSSTQDNTIILFGSQHVPSIQAIKAHAEYLIVYNLEQLHFGRWGSMISSWATPDIDEIWDYSQSNIEYMQSHYPEIAGKIRKVRLGYSPFFTIPALPIVDRRLAFIGNTSDRRVSLLSELAVPYKVYNHHYYNDYNTIVAQHGVFLNIHYQNPAILEVARILPLVCNRKRVLSEPSQDQELDDMFRGLVDFDFDPRLIEDITEQGMVEWETSTADLFEQFKEKHRFEEILRAPFLSNPRWVSHASNVKLCIATLHCNDRQTIFKTMDSLLENTDIVGYNVQWVILSQGSSEEHNEEIEDRLKKSGVGYTIIPLLVNMGWSNGMNELYQHITKEKFTHVLHLEDDWLCDSSPVGRQWLNDCVMYMTHHTDVSTLFLRRYKSEHEKQYYGWSRSFRYQCFRQAGEAFHYQSKIEKQPRIQFRSLELRHIPTFMYTANPTLFRLQDYIDHGVFPFPVFKDASHNQVHWSTTTTKDAPEWGHSEALSMEKLLSTKCMNVNKGFFYHHF